MKELVTINFSEYFRYIREEQNLRKAAKLLYVFLTTPNKVEIYVQLNSCVNCIHRYNVDILDIFDSGLQMINTKPMIENKLKELLSELKSLKFRQN